MRPSEGMAREDLKGALEVIEAAIDKLRDGMIVHVALDNDFNDEHASGNLVSITYEAEDVVVVLLSTLGKIEWRMSLWHATPLPPEDETTSSRITNGMSVLSFKY